MVLDHGQYYYPNGFYGRVPCYYHSMDAAKAAIEDPDRFGYEFGERIMIAQAGEALYVAADCISGVEI